MFKAIIKIFLHYIIKFISTLSIYFIILSRNQLEQFGNNSCQYNILLLCVLVVGIPLVFGYSLQKIKYT